MSLRQKTLIVLSGLFAGLISVLSGSLYLIFLNGVARLEKQDTYQNMQRAIAVVQREISLLDILVEDWAYWDDLYEFMETRDPSFLNNNLTRPVLENFNLNFIAILDLQGNPAFILELDGEKEQNIPVPPILKQQLSPNRKRLNQDNVDSSLEGFILWEEEILATASKPVLNSKEQGPIRGTLAFGRYINRQKIQEFSERTQLALKIHRLGDVQLSEKLHKIRDRLEKRSQEDRDEVPMITQTLNREKISGYTLFRDIENRPAFLLEVTIPRDLYQQSQKTLAFIIGSLAIVGILFSIGIFVVLERMILLRLSRVSQTVRQIGISHDLSRRIFIKGKDELNHLANTINWMLSSLETSEQELEQKQKRLEEEQKKAERLLLNILPEPIAQTLKSDQSAIAENFDEVTILFADIVGFTALSSRLSAIELVKLLNEIFSQFDKLVDKFGLEKIKTIGDAYMIASGLPIPREDHAEAMADMALAMQNAVSEFQRKYEQSLQIRIGINTGVAVAGVIGTKKFIYDLWGDAVNVASRMESSGKPGAIQITESTYARLRDKYNLEKRGTVQVKGKGEMITYWLNGKKGE
ncbi:MAG: adenylate/guanylate cyclase domain-containing protein [Cyanobacteria bacterium P01_E01_bin.42]